jgi:hypothetical protein
MEKHGVSEEQIKNFISEATILDTVLQCADRTTDNISILVDANTNEPKGFAPHFDFGCCDYDKSNKRFICEPFRVRHCTPTEEIISDLSKNGIDLKSAWNSVSSAVDTVLSDKNSGISGQFEKVQMPVSTEEYLDGYRYNAEFLDNAVNRN